jgi:hypothetical protein
VISALRRLRQEDCGFEASLSYTAKCLKERKARREGRRREKGRRREGRGKGRGKGRAWNT